MRSLINYCNNTRDFMVPSVWGQVRRDNYASYLLVPNGYPGRQARGSIRANAKRRLLYHHVMAITIRMGLMSQ